MVTELGISCKNRITSALRNFASKTRIMSKLSGNKSRYRNIIPMKATASGRRKIAPSRGNSRAPQRRPATFKFIDLQYPIRT